MIFDNTLVATVGTVVGAFAVSTSGADLMPNAANYPLSSPLLEPGVRFTARFRVSEAFTTATDAAICLHAVASSDPGFASGVITLATVPAPLQVFNGVGQWLAFKASTLTLNATFDVLLSPLTIKQDTSIGALGDMRKARYLGGAVSIPNYATPASITAGKIEVSFLMNTSRTNETDRSFASAFKVS